MSISNGISATKEALLQRFRHGGARPVRKEGRGAVTRLHKLALGALLTIAVAVPLSAAGPSGYWALPASTSNTDVVCSTCPCVSPSNCANGKKRVGYPATLGRYVGRFLDSQNTEDYQS